MYSEYDRSTHLSSIKVLMNMKLSIYSIFDLCSFLIVVHGSFISKEKHRSCVMIATIVVILVMTAKDSTHHGTLS